MGQLESLPQMALMSRRAVRRSTKTPGQETFSILIILSGIPRETWRKVIPWNVQRVQVTPDEYFEQEEYLSSILAPCRTLNDISSLFQPTDGPPEQRENRDALRIRYFSESAASAAGSASPTRTFNYGVMPSLIIECVGDGRLSLGAILEYCY